MSNYRKFEPGTPLEVIDEELKKLPVDKTDCPLAARLKDGSYQIVGHLVKYEDCPQEVFDEVIIGLSQVYD